MLYLTFARELLNIQPVTLLATTKNISHWSFVIRPDIASLNQLYNLKVNLL